jgi:hypothetical protein
VHTYVYVYAEGRKNKEKEKKIKKDLAIVLLHACEQLHDTSAEKKKSKNTLSKK